MQWSGAPDILAHFSLSEAENINNDKIIYLLEYAMLYISYEETLDDMYIASSGSGIVLVLFAFGNGIVQFKLFLQISSSYG